MLSSLFLKANPRTNNPTPSYKMVCIFSACFATSYGSADSSLSTDLACPKTTTVVTANIQPLVAIVSDKPVGALTNSVLNLLELAAIKPDYRVSNWARALKNAETGLVSAIYPALYSAERAHYLNYELPAIGYVSLSLYAHTISKPARISITAHTRIATLRSMSLSDTDILGAKITEVASFDQAFKMLRRDRVDYVFSTTEITTNYIKQNKIGDIMEVKKIRKLPVFLALSKTHINYQALYNCLSSASLSAYHHITPTIQAPSAPVLEER